MFPPRGRLRNKDSSMRFIWEVSLRNTVGGRGKSQTFEGRKSVEGRSMNK